jgi:P4 family phage/plasmid primase-like protien
MRTLIQYLQSHKSSQNGSKTHTIIPNTNNANFKFGGSYDIQGDDLSKLYEEWYHYCFEEKQTLALTEQIGPLSPLLIDIDLKYQTKETDRQYTVDTINRLISLIDEKLSIYFDVSDSQKVAYLFEKAEPLRDDNEYLIKDGVHIVFPNIIGSSKVFNHFLSKFCENKAEIEDIFDSTCRVAPHNSVEDIFDTNVKRWFVYGASKPGGIPYLISRVIQTNTMEVVENTFDTKQLIQTFSLIQKFECNVGYKHNIDSVLREIPKSNSSMNVNLLRDFVDETDSDEEYMDESEKEMTKEIKHMLQADKIDNIKDYVLKCLKDERAQDYGLWIHLGICLKNIGGDILFTVWNTFSQRGDSYKGESDCRKVWDGLANGPCENQMGMGTLLYWSKLDNVEAFYKIKENSLNDKMDKCVKAGGSHDDIANLVYQMFSDEFVCADLKNQWFRFTGYKWETCKNGWKLQAKLSDFVGNMFHRASLRYNDLNKLQGDALGPDYEKLEESSFKIYRKLKDINFVKNIMEVCRIKFYDPEFLDNMDNNLMLVGYENAVFDLEKNVLREGKLEDCITITTGLRLPILEDELPMNVNTLWKHISHRDGLPEEEWANAKVANPIFLNNVKQIQRFIGRILPDKEIRTYCIRYIASRLCGKVVNQRFSIWTGGGGNGKSILVDLIRAAFGKYCINLPVTLLTQKRKASNAASPEKARTRGVRFCYMQEPDNNEKLNAGEMKELTGGDMIQARNLFCDPIEFKPQYEIMLMCNHKPTIDDNSHGTWRRVQVYPFKSQFVEDTTKINREKHIYKMDKSLSSKLDSWAVTFMGLLLTEWETMGGCVREEDIPRSIRMETESYKNDNDHLGKWMSEDLTVSDEVTDFSKLYNAFDVWWNENYGKNSMSDRSTVKDYLITWQKKSDYGFSDGPNGTIRYPKFNLSLVKHN